MIFFFLVKPYKQQNNHGLLQHLEQNHSKLQNEPWFYHSKIQTMILEVTKMVTSFSKTMINFNEGQEGWPKPFNLSDKVEITIFPNWLSKRTLKIITKIIDRHQKSFCLLSSKAHRVLISLCFRLQFVFIAYTKLYGVIVHNVMIVKYRFRRSFSRSERV